MRFRLLTLTLPLAIVIGFAARVAFDARERKPPSASPRSEPAPPSKSEERPFVAAEALAMGRNASLPVFFDGVRKASAAQIADIAANLLTHPQQARDETIWALVLARWAEVDATAMMTFVDAQWHHTCAALPILAWQSWGAADPEAAFAAVMTQPEDKRRAMLAGAAAVDPNRAATMALKLPNAQFMVGAAMQQLVRHDAQAALSLLPRAVYDGAREPIQRAVVEELAKSDPDQALAVARQAGRIWDDREAETLAIIARHHPDKAIELVESMPDSRGKALSSIAVARMLAATDEAMALNWVRASLHSPVRDAALVEIAATTGGADPSAGLALLQEAGWRDGESVYEVEGEGHNSAEAMKIGASLLRQWATSDPDGARTWLDTQAPDHHKSDLAKAAGLAP